VRVRDRVANGEVGGVEDADVAAETVEDAGGFEGHEFGIGPGSHSILAIERW
jgi:hypothetical protein